MIRLWRILVVAIAAGATWDAPAAGIELDSPMDHDPGFVLPGTTEFLPPEFKKLWIEALGSPETEMRMRAADAIARARLRGLDDLAEAAEPLARVLADDDQGLPVRLAAARALVALDARRSAQSLLRQADKDGLEMRQIAEPALAAWDFRPARPVWRARLDADRTPHQHLILAIRCLGAVGEREATPKLKEIVSSRGRSAGVRLEAARALGRIETEGLEGVAETLAAGPAVIDRLAAASSLTSHRSDRAVALLKNLALDREPSVAAIALRRLLDIDPALVAPFAGEVVRNPDANVRRLGSEALVSVPSPDGVAILGPLLDDPHPDVRTYVRDSLYQLAEKPELDSAVRQAGTVALAGESWRGQEQASMLLGALDHEPAADRLISLLDRERPEVAVASAWALRRLAVADTLSPMLEAAGRADGRVRSGPQRDGDINQLSQLFQAFAEMNHTPAEPLMRTYVPKQPTIGFEARAAAVWALGRFHAGTPDPELVPQFEERLLDVSSDPPEVDRVRRMAAVGLGRMNAEAALPALRQFYSTAGAYGYVTAACNWAVTQLTGERFPAATPRAVTDTDWFLTPL